MTVRGGTVYLVGAGPGHPGLITVRGLEVLRRADVVVHDRLVARELLEEARPGAVMIDVGKAPGDAPVAQDRINEILVERARGGAAVVRLKGGDPFVFGRGSEELAWCRTNGVPCEVVPGITSAIAGPGAAGVPVTRRGEARSFCVVTARSEEGDRSLDHLDFGALARVDTLIVMMGVGVIEEFAERLVEAGRDPGTPVAIVERATQPGQREVRGTLAAISGLVRDRQVRAPATIVIGEVAHAPSDHGPLGGRRIVVTRPTDAAHELIARIRALGGEPVHVPLIRIVACETAGSWIERLGEFDWVVVTSRHGARGLVRSLRLARLDARALRRARIAAVGPTTARELDAGGVFADLVPGTHRAVPLVESLLREARPGQRVLFVRGSLARDVLPAGLAAGGLEVEEAEVYETHLREPTACERHDVDRGFDSVLFASPSAVRGWTEAGLPRRGVRSVCIGPTTAEEAVACGFDPAPVVAEDHSDEGMVAIAVSMLGTQEVAG